MFTSDTATYRKANFLGRKALFTDMRLSRDALPSELYLYELRENEYSPEYNRHGEPKPPQLSIAKSVVCNYFGSVVLLSTIDSIEKAEKSLGEDWGLSDNEISLTEGLSWLKR